MAEHSLGPRITRPGPVDLAADQHLEHPAPGDPGKLFAGNIAFPTELAATA
ncbi:hypothetical protein [Streptomyces sp. HUAS TT7]|uniref:hypothetical protein n=1 Tax=Streptomyces sp. HUAS TT7 TaxID=3447507 RepID=UPI003F658339